MMSRNIGNRKVSLDVKNDSPNFQAFASIIEKIKKEEPSIQFKFKIAIIGCTGREQIKKMSEFSNQHEIIELNLAS
jgi:hypothetical protein